MTKISDKRCIQNQNPHIIFKKYLPENPALYEIMWKNTVLTAADNIIRRMRLACRQLKLLSHSEYVIIIAFLR